MKWKIAKICQHCGSTAYNDIIRFDTLINGTKQKTVTRTCAMCRNLMYSSQGPATNGLIDEALKRLGFKKDGSELDGD